MNELLLSWRVEVARSWGRSTDGSLVFGPTQVWDGAIRTRDEMDSVAMGILADALAEPGVIAARVIATGCNEAGGVHSRIREVKELAPDYRLKSGRGPFPLPGRGKRLVRRPPGEAVRQRRG